VAQSQLRKYFSRPYLEKNIHKSRAGGVVKVVGPEFNPQHCKKTPKKP
jgi:hypothetical protein